MQRSHPRKGNPFPPYMSQAASRVVEMLESRVLLSAVTWTGKGDGTTWTNPANWSTGALPGAADDVTINVSPAVTVQFSSGTQAIHSLTSSDPINLSGGSLQVATSSTLQANLTLSGGTVQGGTLNFANGSELVGTLSGGYLNANVTVNGNLDLSQSNNANVTVQNGLVLNGTILLGNASGSTSGQVRFGLSNISPSGTLGGTGSVVFGPSVSNELYNYSSQSGTAGILTLGPGITLRGANGTINNYYSGGIVNQGTVSADTPASTITISGGSFTNSGSLQAANGGTLNLNDSWSNVAGATVTANASTLGLGSGSYGWNNAGTITAIDSTVNLGGSFTQAAMSAFSRTGGTVNLHGIVSGGLSLDATTGSWNLFGGTVQGGTLSESGGSELVGTTSGGYLNANVTVNGNLDLSQSNAHLTIQNGLTLNGTALIGSSVAGASTSGSQLDFAGTQTLTGTGTVLFGGYNP